MGNGVDYAKVSHYGWACSAGKISYAIFVQFLKGKLSQVFLKHIFLSRLLFCLPPFLHKGISGHSNLYPNNQMLLIYF